jgi:hypothetical protein
MQKVVQVTDLLSTLHIEVVKPYRFPSTSNTSEHTHPLWLPSAHREPVHSKSPPSFIAARRGHSQLMKYIQQKHQLSEVAVSRIDWTTVFIGGLFSPNVKKNRQTSFRETDPDKLGQRLNDDTNSQEFYGANINF